MKLISKLKTDLGFGPTPRTMNSAPHTAPPAASSTVTAVKVGSGLLWFASAVWTFVSVGHIIGKPIPAAVITILLEAAYGAATLYFHHTRNRLSKVLLGAALIPVVAALAIADHQMFGTVGVFFAAGPIVAEGGFLLAARLAEDPTAPDATQRAELYKVMRDAAHESAMAEETLKKDVAGIRAASDRKVAEIEARAASVLAANRAHFEIMSERQQMVQELAATAPLTLPSAAVRGALDAADDAVWDTALEGAPEPSVTRTSSQVITGVDAAPTPTRKPRRKPVVKPSPARIVDQLTADGIAFDDMASEAMRRFPDADRKSVADAIRRRRNAK